MPATRMPGMRAINPRRTSRKHAFESFSPKSAPANHEPPQMRQCANALTEIATNAINFCSIIGLSGVLGNYRRAAIGRGSVRQAFRALRERFVSGFVGGFYKQGRPAS